MRRSLSEWQAACSAYFIASGGALAIDLLINSRQRSGVLASRFETVDYAYRAADTSRDCVLCLPRAQGSICDQGFAVICLPSIHNKSCDHSRRVVHERPAAVPRFLADKLQQFDRLTAFSLFRRAAFLLMPRKLVLRKHYAAFYCVHGDAVEFLRALYSGRKNSQTRSQPNF